MKNVFLDIRGHTIVPHLLSRDSVVLDLGANRGEFSHLVLSQFGCRCYAVEPVLALYQQIPAHPRLTTVNCAVAGRSGELNFYPSDNPEAGSLLPSSPNQPHGSITVPALPLAELLDRWHISRVDLVKMDIEGAEIGTLSACSDQLLQSVTQFTIEFHDFNGLSTPEEVHETLHRFRSLQFWVYRYNTNSHGNVLVAAARTP